MHQLRKKMIQENLKQILSDIPSSVTLVAVSKTKPIEDIMQAYSTGQRIFGENKVQEMTSKYQHLPKDIEWHMIGHLQRNKIKYIAPYISLIHSVDSLSLLQTINKEAEKNQKIINCLLQVYIATEETKYGLDELELEQICYSVTQNQFPFINIKGLMGMASFTENEELIRKEFHYLKTLFDKSKTVFFNNNEQFSILSMGMSGDYKIAIEEGSNMVRIGSSIFGERIYSYES